MQERVIVLVEDNPAEEMLTVEALRSSGVEQPVFVARDGQQAVDYLLNEGAQHDSRPNPHFVLLDLKLPKVSGLEVLRRIREHERTRLIPVVIFTSSSEQEDINKSYERGANSYVRKPVEFEKFMEAVRMLGAYWLTLSERPT